MFVPRTLIIAGLALIAIALGASGHGLWWLVGLVWAFGWTRGGRHACHSGRVRHGSVHAAAPAAPAAPSAAAPDPTHDRHEAFPAR